MPAIGTHPKFIDGLKDLIDKAILSGSSVISGGGNQICLKDKKCYLRQESDKNV